MRSFAALGIVVLGVAIPVVVPAVAGAQVRWDAGLGAGVMQRLATGGEAHAPSPMLGPMAELHAHLALVPMVRAGPYVAFDVSPVSGRPGRQMTEAGLRLKVTPPLLSAPWRTWAFVGLGYARSYAPSYLTTASASGGGERVPGASGGILDLPVGVGVGVKVRGPWAIFAELGGRVGLFFTGAMYDRAQCLCSDAYVGKDSFAVALTVGVSLDE